MLVHFFKKDKLAILNGAVIQTTAPDEITILNAANVKKDVQEINIKTSWTIKFSQGDKVIINRASIRFLSKYKYGLLNDCFLIPENLFLPVMDPSRPVARIYKAILDIAISGPPEGKEIGYRGIDILAAGAKLAIEQRAQLGAAIKHAEAGNLYKALVGCRDLVYAEQSVSLAV